MSVIPKGNPDTWPPGSCHRSTRTTACWWRSLATLGGLALNGAFGWWWADPLAALAMTGFIAHEGHEAWRGEACGCEG